MLKNSSKTVLKIGLAVFMLWIAVIACNMPGSVQNTPTSVIDAVSTSVAQTAAAQNTLNPPTPFPTMALPTTPSPPTETPQPQPTAVPPTATALPCNRADFVADVNYPDNSVVLAGAAFSKTWRLKNNGSCHWTSGYQLVFNTGDRMGAPDSQALTTGIVSPGQVVDVTVLLAAPLLPGTYRGEYLLRAPDGTRFGIGASGTNAFWVQVIVPTPTPTITATATTKPTETFHPTPSGIPIATP